MTKHIDKIINEYQSQMFLDLETIVNLNSFTTNENGIDLVLAALVNIAKKHDVNLEKKYSSKKDRPHLMYGEEKEKNYFAFIGHFDTVHPPSSSFNKLEKRGNILTGPGINDMKSGLIIALYSFVILKNLYPNIDLPIKILFNSDEETGSLDSKEIIKLEFINAKAGFVFEPGRIQGAIVTTRKGWITLDIEIIGKPAHSGIAPWDGVNSLLVACEIVQKLQNLNDYKNGVIVGCNQLVSGVARNVVPAHSTIAVDIRFQTMCQKDTLFKKIENILNEKNALGVVVKYNLELNRPPLEMNEESKKLSQLYKNISKKLGHDCTETETGGVSDGNFLSSMGIPVLDGLGAVGNFSHTKEEYIEKDSLIYRTKIFVLFMVNLLDNHRLTT